MGKEELTALIKVLEQAVNNAPQTSEANMQVLLAAIGSK